MGKKSTTKPEKQTSKKIDGFAAVKNLKVKTQNTLAKAKNLKPKITKKQGAETQKPTTQAPKQITPPVEIQPPQEPIEDKGQKSTIKLPLLRKLYIKPSYIALGIIGLLVAIFFLRVAIWEHGYLKRMEGSERHVAAQTTSENPDDFPEETDDTELTEEEIATYEVAPNKPRYLTIPSLAGISKTRILEIGKRSNGELSTPYNIYDVGWYISSALPGERGVSIMDGHGGAPGIGVFGNLTLIKPDALIQIEMGDGRVFTYKVVDTATKALGDEADAYMTTAFKSPKTGVPSLTLITCTGDYWLSRRTYSHRFFVRALLVE